MEYVDNYCERTAPGLWGEPVNALTNLAFLVACGFLLYLLVRRARRAPLSIWLLPITTGAVGLCSLAFHTFATRFTALLDTLSIAVFIVIAVAVAVHWVWAVRWRWAVLTAPAFLVFAAGLSAGLAAFGVVPVLGGYLTALITLAGFGIAILFTAPRELRQLGILLLGAAALFAVSLTLRTLDAPLCEVLPVGTHFVWHCLNAGVLFLVSYSVIRSFQLRTDVSTLGTFTRG
ncbi:ceramidase domain-containing protein [Mycolicibacterium iranicum]|uniref:Ceramidase n=1 Tax=Mycolicibacterium iranicum TaxID=912594 RepID=A0A178M1A8_MYCIR|nr:ceramidase domain-containing protein [Mycolicibacterium iranicum]OAN41780.1 hypothetical protein A4X20_02700 [Mycolicibacterium iranicum]